MYSVVVNMVRSPVLVIFAYEMEEDVPEGEPIAQLLQELAENHNLITGEEELMIVDKNVNAIYGSQELVGGIVRRLSKMEV